MPYVNIQITKGATREQKSELVKDITESLVRVLSKKPEHVHIVIQEIKEEDWGILVCLPMNGRKAKNSMTPDEIIKIVVNNLHGVVPKSSWGETSLFYNPGKKLPNGVYFCTIKEKDGENDTSSNLNRSKVFRLSIGVLKES